MSAVVASLITMAATLLLGWVLGFRKSRSEIELNQMNIAKGVVTMSLELSEEVKQFYEIRTAFLEQRIVALEKTVAEQAQLIANLRGEL